MASPGWGYVQCMTWLEPLEGAVWVEPVDESRAEEQALAGNVHK